MAKRTTRSRGGPSRARPVSFGDPKVRRSTEEDRTKTVYQIDVPKDLKDDPDAVAKFLASYAKRIHGAGGKAYKDQHFMMTYTGIMYEEDDKDSEKMSRATFGTYAHRNLKVVEEDLRQRLKRLQEGETPRTVGPAAKYGFFANGITQAAVIVMERVDELDLPSRGRAQVEFVGSREIDGEPYLDVRTRDGVFTVPAEKSEIPHKPRLGEQFEIRMMKGGTYRWAKPRK